MSSQQFFTQNVKYYSKNVKYYSKNVKYFTKNVKYYTTSDKRTKERKKVFLVTVKDKKYKQRDVCEARDGLLIKT